MRTRTAAVLTAFLTLVLVAGCSSKKATVKPSSSPSPTVNLTTLPTADVIAKAVAYLKSADAVTVVGKGTQGGTALEINFTFTSKDSGGSMSLAGAAFEFRSIGGVSYLKLSNQFWHMFGGAGADASIKKYGGKWLKVDKDNTTFGNLTALADRNNFLGDVLKPTGKVTFEADKTVNGIDCVTLKDNSAKTPSLVYLAKDDARPVEIDNLGAEGGKLSFSYGGQAPAAPPAGDVVDAPKVGG